MFTLLTTQKAEGGAGLKLPHSLWVGINRGPPRNIFISLKTALTVGLRAFVKPIPLKVPMHPCKVPH